jgi:hypothetical protein
VKKQFTILSVLKTDAASEIPDILYNYGLTDFSVYEIGQSRDERQLGFFIYPDAVNINNSMEKYQIVFQLQLPGVTVDQVAKYTDAVAEWLSGYDMQKIGFTDIENISIDTWPNAKDRSSFVYFDVIFSEQKDSCD